MFREITASGKTFKMSPSAENVASHAWRAHESGNAAHRAALLRAFADMIGCAPRNAFHIVRRLALANALCYPDSLVSLTGPAYVIALTDAGYRAVNHNDVVRGAYQALATRPGEWVALAAIRSHLDTTPRADVDAALRSLAVQPGVHLIPWDNRGALSAADHQAALRFGGQDNHALRFDPTN